MMYLIVLSDFYGNSATLTSLQAWPIFFLSRGANQEPHGILQLLEKGNSIWRNKKIQCSLHFGQKPEIPFSAGKLACWPVVSYCPKLWLTTTLQELVSKAHFGFGERSAIRLRPWLIGYLQIATNRWCYGESEINPRTYDPMPTMLRQGWSDCYRFWWRSDSMVLLFL